MGKEAAVLIVHLVSAGVHGGQELPQRCFSPERLRAMFYRELGVRSTAWIDRARYDETSSIAQKSLANLAPLIGEASELVLVPVMYS